MKSLTALLVAAALILPAFAQNVALHPNPVLQDAQKRHTGPIAILAIKPILLHTGKPLTQNDKQLLLASTIILYTGPVCFHEAFSKVKISAG